MINSNNEIVNSIPSNCKNYDPNKAKLVNARCSKLGQLFECKNYKGKIEGCIFCENYEKL